MILTITIIIFLAALIVTHEFGHFITAKLFKLRVDEFAFGFPPRIFAKKWKDTLYTLNAIPFGGFVKIFGENEEGIKEGGEIVSRDELNRSFYIQPAWKRFIIIAAGVIMNFFVGWMAFSIILFFVGIPQSLYVKTVIPDSPAEQAGFVKGEKIVGFASSQDFINYIDVNAGNSIFVNGREIVPRVNPPAKEGRIGVALEEGDFLKYSIIASISRGFSDAVHLIQRIFSAVFELISNMINGTGSIKELTGPIGIFQEIDRVSAYGFLYLIQFLGVLSLNLAVFNMLPIPALDGGRMLFILIEQIVGRRLNPRHEAIANVIGFSLLILLAITVTINDIIGNS